MLRKNKQGLINICKSLNEDSRTTYKGFTIIRCFDNFDNRYFTIVNPRNGSHVHAKSLKLATQICDISRHMYYNPAFKTKEYNKSVILRALRLLHREVKTYH